MRKVTFGGANSLDNDVARPDHGTDWLKWDDEVAAVTAAYWEGIDTVLMGRKTYEVAARSDQAGGYPGVKNYVFSRTLEEMPGGTVRRVVSEVGATRDDKPTSSSVRDCNRFRHQWR